MNHDVRWCWGLSQDAWEAGLLSCMCLDWTQCRQGSSDALEATRYGSWVQEAQDAQDAESRLGESGRNTTISDAGLLFADASRRFNPILIPLHILVSKYSFYPLSSTPQIPYPSTLTSFFTSFFFYTYRLMPIPTFQGRSSSKWTLSWVAYFLTYFCSILLLTLFVEIFGAPFLAMST